MRATKSDSQFDFDENAEFAIGADDGRDETLLGAARFFIAGAGDALFAENDFGFGEVAFGLNESLFAIHHAGSGTFAEFFYQLCANLSHFVLCVFPVNRYFSTHTMGDQAGWGWSPLQL